MAIIGTPLTASATKLLLLGSGELGKEVAIEAQRLGVEVIAVDRYPNAPAMQIAHRSHVVSMLDAEGPAHNHPSGKAGLRGAGDRGHRHRGTARPGG